MTPINDTQLRNALQGLAADISANHAPQPATTLWLRAQHRGRQAAIARAALPLRIMHAFGTLAAILTAAFALHQSHAATIPNPFSTLWISLATVTLLAGCAAIFFADRHFSLATSASIGSSH